MRTATLSRPFTIGWALIGLAMALLEISGPRYLTLDQIDHAWDLLFYVFMAWEIVAAVRKQKGDTFSEHIWAFETGPARLVLVTGLVFWLGFRFSHLGAGHVDPGRIALALGLVGWLLPHFWFKGRHG